MIHIHIHRKPRPCHPQPKLLLEWDNMISRLRELECLKGGLK